MSSIDRMQENEMLDREESLEAECKKLRWHVAELRDELKRTSTALLVSICVIMGIGIILVTLVLYPMFTVLK